MDSTNDDLFLLRKGLRLYHTQTVQQKTKSPDEKKDQFYTFGPIVMRAFYYLDIPDIAIEVLPSHIYIYIHLSIFPHDKSHFIISVF